MRRILDIGHTDLRLFLKSKSAYIWLFAVPLAFVYFMGFANRGPGNPYNRRPPVLVENHDTNFLGRVFLDELDTQGMWLLDPTNREAAARTIRIPEDFSRKVLAGEQSKVGFFQRDGSAESDAAIIEARLVRALIAMNSHLLEAATQTNAPETITEEQLREVMKKPNPVSLDAKFAGRKPVPSGFNFSLPGNLVMYLMMNLMIFGGVCVRGPRRRVLRVGKPVDGRVGWLLVAAGDCPSGAPNRCPVSADRLGIESLASAHQLRQRLRPCYDSTGGVARFRRGGKSPGGTILPELNSIISTWNTAARQA
jgi:hypothetical protein